MLLPFLFIQDLFLGSTFPLAALEVCVGRTFNSLSIKRISFPLTIVCKLCHTITDDLMQKGINFYWHSKTSETLKCFCQHLCEHTVTSLKKLFVRELGTRIENFTDILARVPYLLIYDALCCRGVLLLSMYNYGDLYCFCLFLYILGDMVPSMSPRRRKRHIA